MPDSSDDLSAQLKRFQTIYERQVITEADFRTFLRGLRLSDDEISWIERQIIVQGDYFDQHRTTEPPISSPTLTSRKSYASLVTG